MADDRKTSEPNRGRSAPAKRRQNRIAAMQFLYAWNASATHGDLADELYAFFAVPQASPEKDAPADAAFADTENRGNPREFYAFAEELVTGTLKNLTRVDGVISDAAQNWELSRIARCDLAILRLAVYELLYRTDIPPVVSINEAIDLAKTFSSEESHRFVNGVLDRVKKHLSRPLRTAL
ncbi:MAG: transcription antitermination factor NusB [Candidatus Spyradosoma sp.]